MCYKVLRALTVMQFITAKSWYPGGPDIPNFSGSVAYSFDFNGNFDKPPLMHTSLHSPSFYRLGNEPALKITTQLASLMKKDSSNSDIVSNVMGKSCTQVLSLPSSPFNAPDGISQPQSTRKDVVDKRTMKATLLAPCKMGFSLSRHQTTHWMSRGLVSFIVVFYFATKMMSPFSIQMIRGMLRSVSLEPQGHNLSKTQRTSVPTDDADEADRQEIDIDGQISDNSESFCESDTTVENADVLADVSDDFNDADTTDNLSDTFFTYREDFELPAVELEDNGTCTKCMYPTEHEMNACSTPCASSANSIMSAANTEEGSATDDSTDAASSNVKGIQRCFKAPGFLQAAQLPLTLNKQLNSILASLLEKHVPTERKGSFSEDAGYIRAAVDFARRMESKRQEILSYARNEIYEELVALEKKRDAYMAVVEPNKHTKMLSMLFLRKARNLFNQSSALDAQDVHTFKIAVDLDYCITRSYLPELQHGGDQSHTMRSRVAVQTLDVTFNHLFKKHVGKSLEEFTEASLDALKIAEKPSMFSFASHHQIRPIAKIYVRAVNSSDESCVDISKHVSMITRQYESQKALIQQYIVEAESSYEEFQNKSLDEAQVEIQDWIKKLRDVTPQFKMPTGKSDSN